jgi:hypothetical protein
VSNIEISDSLESEEKGSTSRSRRSRSREPSGNEAANTIVQSLTGRTRRRTTSRDNIFGADFVMPPAPRSRRKNKSKGSVDESKNKSVVTLQVKKTITSKGHSTGRCFCIFFITLSWFYVLCFTFRNALIFQKRRFV